MLRLTLFVMGLPMFLCAIAICGESIEVGESAIVCPQPPDLRDQVLPDVAFDGDKTFLIVWQQGQKFFEGPDPKVFAARISADGKALDIKPIEICANKGAQESPHVVYCKGVFLVVWQDFRNTKDWDVYATRVTSDGKVLDSEGIAVSAGPGNQALPVLATAPDGFLLGWQDFRNGMFYQPFVAKMSLLGKVAPSTGVELKYKGQSLAGGSISLVRAKDIWFVSWNDERSFQIGAPNTWRFGRIDENLNILDIAPGGFGRFASDGQNALSVSTYSAGHGGACNPAVAALFEPTSSTAIKNPNEERKNGVGAGTSGYNTERMIILREPEAGAQGVASAGFDGIKYLVAFRGMVHDRNLSPAIDNQIFVVRLALDGKRLDDTEKQTVLHDGAVPGSNPVVAGGKEAHFLVVYEVDYGSSKHQVIARMVNAK